MYVIDLNIKGFNLYVHIIATVLYLAGRNTGLATQRILKNAEAEATRRL
jgi:hypothetical protein